MKFLSIIIILIIFAASLSGQENKEKEINELKNTIDELKKKIEKLEQELKELKEKEEEKIKQEELKKILQEADKEISSEASSEKKETLKGKEFYSYAKSLQALNPEISVTGDVLAKGSSEKENLFDAREFEFSFISMLDPYAQMKIFLSIENLTDVELEEAYMEWLSFPGGLRLLVGKKQQQFGNLNRWHTHALPQVDLPLAIRYLFGDEGLRQTGIFLDWLLPKGWAKTNELILEITKGDNEKNFGGNNFRRPAVLTHLINYWDISRNTYFEFDISAMYGYHQAEPYLRTKLLNLSPVISWTPTYAARFRSFEWRSEFIYSLHQYPEKDIKSFSFFSYFYYQWSQRMSAGLRFDYVEDPFEEKHKLWSLTPFIDFWQSEWVRLRGQYSLLRDRTLDKNIHSIILQFTWSAGPHKHEKY